MEDVHFSYVEIYIINCVGISVVFGDVVAREHVVGVRVGERNERRDNGLWTVTLKCLTAWEVLVGKGL